MTTKKIPISFNEEDLANIAELAQYMGIRGVYGELPKTVKFSIMLALAAVKDPQKVYTNMKPNELKVYFQSVAYGVLFKRDKKIAEDLLKSHEKV